MNAKYFQCVFYVPVADAKSVKQAVFHAGAGRLGQYTECCWEIEGFGQFRPMKGADPALGSAGTLEKVRELRVECIVAKEFKQAVKKALVHAHPYEEPAYHFIAVDID